MSSEANSLPDDDLKPLQNLDLNDNQGNGNASVDIQNDAGDEAVPDSRGFSIFTRTTKTTVIESTIGVSTTPFDALDYAMRSGRRGKCLILNHQFFDPKTRQSSRNGTQHDGAALLQTFRDLNFEVDVLDNGSTMDVNSKLRALSKEDHSNNDCLVVCVLSHGDRGNLWARDGCYPIDDLYSNFTGERCLTLAGKPKLFFIQACQGDSFDRGVVVQHNQDVADSAASYYKIPNWADFLIVYSTVVGHYSWRNPDKGSWFVQALVEILDKHSKDMDLLSMMTLVSWKVAYNFVSSSNQPEYHGNKQVPCVTSMLTRRVWFNR